jgi:hypothetical protein
MRLKQPISDRNRICDETVAELLSAGTARSFGVRSADLSSDPYSFPANRLTMYPRPRA